MIFGAKLPRITYFTVIMRMQHDYVQYCDVIFRILTDSRRVYFILTNDIDLTRNIYVMYCTNIADKNINLSTFVG